MTLGDRNRKSQPIILPSLLSPKFSGLSLFTFLLFLVAPITSVVVVSQVKGATPGLLLALSLPLLSIAYRGLLVPFFKHLAIFFFLAFLLTTFSQVTFVAGAPYPESVAIINVGYWGEFSSSLLTQGLYLLAGVSVFLFVFNYYDRTWINPILLGGILLSTFGMIEFFAYTFWGLRIDYFSNRQFGLESDSIASARQLFEFSGRTLMRLKSLTGEPSMYSLSIFPYTVIAISFKRYFCAAFFALSLLLSTSASGVLMVGMFIILSALFGLSPEDAFSKRVMLIIATVVVSSAIVIVFRELIVFFLVSRATVEDYSSINRLDSFLSTYKYWKELPLWGNLFGVGWGAVRASDFFSTLLVNTGLVGLSIWVVLWIRPLFARGRMLRSPISYGVVAVFLTMLIAIPEYSYLPPWILLGLAWRQQAVNKIQITRNERGCQ